MSQYNSPQQQTIPGFENPFNHTLDLKNRWVKLAALIPWDTLANQYLNEMKVKFGRPGINPRVVIGSLIIKHICNFTDVETIAHIQENVYMQYFIGATGFSTNMAFDPSLFVHIRKRMGKEVFERMNLCLLEHAGVIKPDAPQCKDNQDDSNTNKSTQTESASQDTPQDDSQSSLPNKETHKGTLIIDASVCPQAIKYPTDLDLLNDARVKTEELIDKLYRKDVHPQKPRTDRKQARIAYLSIIKRKKKHASLLRKGLRKQLGYLKRNLQSIDKLLDAYQEMPLKYRDLRYLWVIHELYRQQQEMFDNSTRSIEHRIVSIHQPHVRPIVRGKSRSPVEFGAKISISLIDGYAHLDHIGWEAHNEANLLMMQIAQYKQRYGYFPQALAVDKIYTNRTNRESLKELGIRLIGTPLGRPTEKAASGEGAIRNAVEGKFGQTKLGYGMSRITTKLKATSESFISAIIFVTNLLKLAKSSIFSFFSLFLLAVMVEYRKMIQVLRGDIVLLNEYSSKDENGVQVAYHPAESKLIVFRLFQ